MRPVPKVGGDWGGGFSKLSLSLTLLEEKGSVITLLGSQVSPGGVIH